MPRAIYIYIEREREGGGKKGSKRAGEVEKEGNFNC